MKRTNNHDHDQQQQKKIKPNDEPSSVNSLSDMSTDVWSVIIKYLPIGSVLMFAMTCKDHYEWTTTHIKNVICKYFVMEEPKKYSDIEPREEFSIIGGLRQMKKLRVGSSNEEEVQTILKEIASSCNGTIGQLSKCLSFSDLSFKRVFELLDIRKEGKTEIKVEIIPVALPDDFSFQGKSDSSDREKVIKTIEYEPVGYDLVELELDMRLTREKLYKILTRTKDLKSLTLTLEQQYFRIPSHPRGKGGTGSISDIDTIYEATEAFDEDHAYVPLLNNLETLIIEKGFDNDSFVFNLLSLAPNLKHFSFVCQDSIDDALLDFLRDNCTKLKTLKIKSDDGATQIELEITDAGLLRFLEKQSQIESIDLEPAAQISGEILKKLGDFPTLKRFRVDRTCYNGDMADQAEDIFFGGKPNPNLEYIDIGNGYNLDQEQSINLINTLKVVAPNLKEIGEFGVQSYKEIVELFKNSLEYLELNDHTLELLPHLEKLKKVVLAMNFSESSIHALSQLSNPNVTTMVIQYFKDECMPLLPHVFPNLKFIEACNSSFINYLTNHTDIWPQLCHLKIHFGLTPEQTELLVSQRSNLFIEFEYQSSSTRTISPQVFYYQWLVREQHVDSK